ncbi:hypothetical protein GBA52_020312 [Prunus armeniaca]|nr:hypothetical protein GBA52_020312 [Prunus armeniaca]
MEGWRRPPGSCCSYGGWQILVLCKKYTVKTGYRVALRQCEGNGDQGESDQCSQQGFSKRIWNLKVPTTVNLFHRKVVNSPTSTRCGVGSEDSGHVLWICKKNNVFLVLYKFCGTYSSLWQVFC